MVFSVDSWAAQKQAQTLLHEVLCTEVLVQEASCICYSL